MTRIKRGIMVRKRHKKLMEQAKGYRGARSRHYKVAHETVMRAHWFAYVDRRKRKRDFRKLWIVRINAAARMNGMSYSVFMNGLKRAGIDLDRKLLANLAVEDAAAFTALAAQAQQALKA